MLRPNPGELLAGLKQSLEEQVLPALPKGVPQQQLKAALHLIGRLRHSWDLTATHLAADNADMEATLSVLLPSTGDGSLEARLAASSLPPIAGYNDPALAAAAARNLALQILLAEQDDTPELRALFARMTARDARYVGDRAEEDGKHDDG